MNYDAKGDAEDRDYLADKQQEEREHSKEALRLAGIMADAATKLVGGATLQGIARGCRVDELPERIAELSKAASAYNDYIYTWSMRT